MASLSLLQGGEIEGKGITPSQTVTLTAEEESRFAFLTEEDDPHLKAALALLQAGGSVTSGTTTAPEGDTAATTGQAAE